MLKKMLLMLIISASLMTVAKAAEKYAVLITGDTHAKSFDSIEAEKLEDSNFSTSLWYDTYLQWELLVDKKGYDPNNIFVLYRLGEDYWFERDEEGLLDPLWERYTPQWISDDHPFIVPGYQITKFPATRESLVEVNRILCEDRHINENDFLYVWTFGHGGSDLVSTSYISMLEDTHTIDPVTGETIWVTDQIYDYEFDDFFVYLPANKKVYSMAQCYAGGFKDNLIADQSGAKVFFDCAAKVDRSAFGVDNQAWPWCSLIPAVYLVENLEREKYQGEDYRHSEFNFHKYSVLAGENPQQQEFYYEELEYEGEIIPAVYFTEADGIGYDPVSGYIDGIITVEEARRWNFAQNTQIVESIPETYEYPDFSDTGNIGYHTSLDYPTLLFNECSDPGSYLYSDPDGINGIVGIPQTLVLDPAFQLKFNNSETTLLDDKVIKIPSGASLSVSNSYLKGFGFDKQAVKGDDSDYLLGNGISLIGGDLLLSSSSLTGIGFPRALGAQISVGEEVVFNNIYLELLLNSVLKSDSYGKLSLDQNTNIIVFNGTVDNLTLSNNGNIILKNNSIIQRTYTNNYSGSEVTIDAAATVNITSNSILIFKEGSLLELSDDAVLIVDNGSDLVIEEGALVRLADGAQIIIKDKSSVSASGSLFSYTGETGKWLGISCEAGSSITLNDVKISGVVTALSGAPSNCTVSNSLFENCINGISIVNCDNYSITLNTLTGMDTGTGVSLAVSNGTFWKNTVENFNYGIRVTSCPPILSNNVICNNKRFGIYVFGYNSNPQLVLSSKAQGLNNSIINNGTNPPSTNPFIFSDAQIGIMPYGNIYLNYGMNNIHSGQPDITPLIPCISISPYVISPWPSPILLPTEMEMLIEAEGNYWGAESVTSAFFDFRGDDYSIDYNPWCEYPLTGETVQPALSSHEPPDTESIILSNAMFLEEKDNYTASIKQYEHIIDKYEDSPEYYIALARLPYVYLKAGLETESLISTYDAGLVADNITQKKFLREMKIATHIKGKRYETAKSLAEEMKAEALTDDEVAISEIDIAICDMMMASVNKSGKDTGEYMDKLTELLINKYDKNSGTYPAVITDVILPEKTTLFQNYPNPFNPVTQIKFDLAKNSNIKLSVYNTSGQLVSELANGVKNAGNHVVDFDGSKLNSGIYYYTLEVDGSAITKKMVLMK